MEEFQKKPHPPSEHAIHDPHPRYQTIASGPLPIPGCRPRIPGSQRQLEQLGSIILLNMCARRRTPTILPGVSDTFLQQVTTPSEERSILIEPARENMRVQGSTATRMPVRKLSLHFQTCVSIHLHGCTPALSLTMLPYEIHTACPMPSSYTAFVAHPFINQSSLSACRIFGYCCPV